MDRNLRAFLAVANSGNLTAAADQIGLTQPALTKTIRRLEEGVGAKFFIRTSRGMVLTEAGDDFRRRAEAIQAHYRQAREEAHARKSGALREFSMAAGVAYHNDIAPQLIKRLSAEFPETRFIIDFDVASHTLPRLFAGQLHLLLGAFLFPAPEGTITEELMEVEVTAFCCQSNPLQGEGMLPAQALAGQRWIIYKRDTDMIQRLNQYYLQHMLPLPRVQMEIDALASILRIVRNTDYLVVGPTALEGAANEAGLVRLRLQQPIWRFRSGAWYRESTRTFPIMQRALELLRQMTDGL